mmetsp:Transcript_39555/g.60428  ORF Transcript_39555/g.60428 Transcript_39555/m.60428 type:complete len:139 (-) Transcript_39555:701-1117(-)
MFPHGCPSFQKAFVKLYRVEKNKQGASYLKLVDTQYFNNRDGFGFMLKNLTKGDYQVQFKKYSNGFDVFDFTVRMFADKHIKLIDDDEEELKKISLSKEVMDKIPSIKEDEPQESDSDSSEKGEKKPDEETKAMTNKT